MADNQDLSKRIEDNLPLVKHIVFQVAVHFPRHVDREELARAGRFRSPADRRRFVAAHAGGHCQDHDDANDLSSCDQDQEIFEVARELPPRTDLVLRCDEADPHRVVWTAALLEELVGVPVHIVSTGPGRDAVIMRHHPFDG